MISEGLRGLMINEKAGREQRQSRLVQYLIETLHQHNSYAVGYFICEALNFINVVSGLSSALQTVHSLTRSRF